VRVFTPTKRPTLSSTAHNVVAAQRLTTAREALITALLALRSPRALPAPSFVLPAHDLNLRQSRSPHYILLKIGPSLRPQRVDRALPSHLHYFFLSPVRAVVLSAQPTLLPFIHKSRCLPQREARAFFYVISFELFG